MQKNSSGPYLRIITTALIITLALLLPSCGNKASLPDDYNYDDLSEYIKLGNYKGIEYVKADTEVSADEIQNYINDALSDTASVTQNTTGTVKADSVINMDYVGSIDGVEFDGGAASDVEFDIADNNYIEGFAEGIIGHSAGETFDLHVTFPSDYGNADLAGKPAVFKTTINYIIEEQVPEYNDDWVAANTEYKTTAEYEESVKNDLAEEKAANADNQDRREVFNIILNDSEVIKYPETELKERSDKIVSVYTEYAEAYGMTFAEYLESAMGTTEEEFTLLADKAAEEQVKNELVLKAIAKEDGIEFKSSDYNDYLVGLLEDAGYTEESYESEKGYTIQEYAENTDLFTNFMYQKVMDKVMEYSVAK